MLHTDIVGPYGFACLEETWKRKQGISIIISTCPKVYSNS